MAINYDKNKERPVVDSVKTGEFLAALRKAAGHTQQEVADYLGITNKTVSKWESGAGLPEISILPAVAEMYGVTVDELLAGKRLERFVEKETAEGHVGGKGEKPEKSEARRKWMENSLQERFHRGKVILWGTILAGYVILVGLYMGFRAVNISAKWIGTTWLGVWLIAEIVGIYWFWIRYSNDLRSWIEERQNEENKAELSLQENLHRCRLQLLLPLMLATSAVIPLVWIEPFVIPANIPAIAGAGGYITSAKQLFTEITYLDMSMATPVTWDLAIGGAFITMERLIKALPVMLMAGCVVWKVVDLLGRRYLKIRAQQTQKHLRKLVISALTFFVVLMMAGEVLQAVKVVNYVQYTSQERFDQYVDNYLLVYNSYRESGKHYGPALEEGVEHINNTYMDYALLGNDHYEKYRGLFAIDYDNCKTYHIAEWSERLAAKDLSVTISALACTAGLLLFWKEYRKDNFFGLSRRKEEESPYVI